MKMAAYAFVVGAVGCAALLSPSAAEACGNSMREHRSYQPNVVDLGTETVNYNLALREASISSSKGDHKRALVRARVALGSPESPVRKKARRIVGLSSLALGDYQTASKELAVAAREHDGAPVLNAKLAEAELGLGNIDRALELLEPLSKDELIPDADGYVALARARWVKLNKDGALAAIDQALKRDARHAGALALKREIEEKSPAAPPSEKKTAKPQARS